MRVVSAVHIKIFFFKKKTLKTMVNIMGDQYTKVENRCPRHSFSSSLYRFRHRLVQTEIYKLNFVFLCIITNFRTINCNIKYQLFFLNSKFNIYTFFLIFTKSGNLYTFFLHLKFKKTKEM